MPNLEKNTPARVRRDLNVARQRFLGMTLKEIAEANQISFQRVSQILKTDEIKIVLEDTIRGYLAEAPSIRDELLSLCRDDDPRVRVQAIRKFNKVTGISPSHMPSMILTQVYNDNRTMDTAEKTQEMRDFEKWRAQQQLAKPARDESGKR